MKNKYENWPTEKIKAETEKMYEVLKARREVQQVKEAQTKCINNITTKDFVVYWGTLGQRYRNDKPEYFFSFTIRHADRDYNIYYENGTYDAKHVHHFYPWWPIVGEEGDEDWDRNGAFEFIPPGFAEACENSYEFRGTVEEAVAQLKKYGFVNFRWHDNDDDVDELKAPNGL